LSDSSLPSSPRSFRYLFPPTACLGDAAMPAACRDLAALADAIVDTAGALVVVLDRHGRIVRFNHACEQTTGYRSDEVEGRLFFELLLAEDERDAVLEVFRGLQAGRFPSRHENDWRTRAGERRRIAWSNTALRDAGGAVVWIIGTGIDVTERARAELALRESEEKYALIAGAVDDIVSLHELDGRFVYVSPSCRRVTGFDPDALVGTDRLAYVHPDDRERVRAATQDLIRRHTDGDMAPPATAEWRHACRDGSYRWLGTRTELLRDAGGRPFRLLCTSRDISERRQAETFIRWQTHHDGLTGLSNRALFQERLAQALAALRPGKAGGALVIVDLDRFKQINETLGHAAGDRMLQKIAERLQEALRPEDQIARIGGDEFALLLPRVEDPFAVARIVRQLLEIVGRPLVLDGHEMHVTASAGIGLFPFDGRDADTLLKHAEIALYRAKGQGPDRYQLYAPTMNATAMERLLLENGLRRGIERGELVLLYQPQIERATGCVSGVEALVRWQHPDLGLIEPAQFIPIAEETGLIGALGERVLTEACRQGALWQQGGSRPLRIGVNLSGRQLGQRGLVKKIETILRQTGLAAEQLELEITESSFVDNRLHAGSVLRRLRRLGVRLSVDDFGMGYSSFSYLRQLPLDTLKIDRSFVRDLADSATDRAIMKALIELAHTLGLDVIAEGVETDGQRGSLDALACDAMQGYLFSPPASAEQIEPLLRNGRSGDAARAARQGTAAAAAGGGPARHAR
jgi:diguanylate cyclase (GGDEF)-like protein/PAS domain S-box-containing protein